MAVTITDPPVKLRVTHQPGKWIIRGPNLTGGSNLPATGIPAFDAVKHAFDYNVTSGFQTFWGRNWEILEMWAVKGGAFSFRKKDFSGTFVEVKTLADGAIDKVPLFIYANEVLSIQAQSYEATDITFTQTGTQHDVVTGADSFLITDGTGALHHFWINVTDGANGQTDPGGSTNPHKIDVIAADSTTVMATKADAVIDALPEFSSTPSAAVVSVTNAAPGDATDATDVDAGVTVNVTGQGVDTELVLLVREYDESRGL